MKFPKGVKKCARPTMRNVRGRTWDSCPVVLPDGTKTTGYYDTTWGMNVYFEAPDGWRCAPIYQFDTQKSSYTITPDFSEKKED